MRYLQIIIIILFLVSITAVKGRADDRYFEKLRKAPAGSVLFERKKPLDCNFFDVTQEIKMPPDHWEAVGHFGFLYYQDKKLSQTSEYSIAPSCKYAVYQDGPTGSIMAYIVEKEEVIILQKESLGFPKEFFWMDNDTKIQITFDQKDKKTYQLP